MIVYGGIRKINISMSFLIFTKEDGSKIEIPIEGPIADRIGLYLLKFTSPPPLVVENDEEAE